MKTVLNFMTACDIEEQEGHLFLKRDDVRIQIVYDKKQLSPTIETIKIDDSSYCLHGQTEYFTESVFL